MTDDPNHVGLNCDRCERIIESAQLAIHPLRHMLNEESRPTPAARQPHPLTMIGRTNHRLLEDGCDGCGKSAVYCDSVQGCCSSCDH